MTEKWIANAINNKNDIIATSKNHTPQYHGHHIYADNDCLSEKTVVIIGGPLDSQELLITRFFMSGANVFFLTTDIRDGHRLARRLNSNKRGNSVRSVNCDFANHAQIQQRLDAIILLVGNIDIFINNISTSQGKIDTSTPAVQPADYLQAAILCASHVYPFMMTKNAGTIINVHSGISLRCAALRGELTGITSGLAKKMGSDNITVNSIVHCLDETADAHLADGVDILNQIQGAYDIARLAVFLASKSCRDLTGQVFVISNHQ